MLRIEFEQNLAANEQAGMWRGQGRGGAFCGIAGPWCGQMLVQRLSPFLSQSLISLWKMGTPSHGSKVQ